jgi:hypothetical protein
MNKKELQEIEGDCEVSLSNGDNVFAEYCLDLIAEVRRLNDFISENYLLDKHGAFENLIQDNQRLRKALEFYESWTGYSPYSNKVEEDKGKVAQKALKGETNEY